MNTRNPETFVNRSKRIVQNTAFALALGSASSAMVPPTAEASANFADCIGFQLPQSGPIEGKMRVSASRRFTLDGVDVSQSLNGSPEVFNNFVDAGNTVEEVTVGRPTFYDVAFTAPDGNSQISRSRFAQGSMDTNSYWIQKDSKGEQQNVGELMTFTSPDTGERYEVTNNCGVKEERRGFTLQASLMFKRGQILKPLENGFKRILEWCITQDHWTHTEALQRPSKPEAPVVVPTPATEVPPTTETFPGQYPAQYTPYRP